MHGSSSSCAGPPARPPAEMRRAAARPTCAASELVPVARLRTRREGVRVDGAEIVDDSSPCSRAQRVVAALPGARGRAARGDERALRRLEKALPARAGRGDAAARPKLYRALDLAVAGRAAGARRGTRRRRGARRRAREHEYRGSSLTTRASRLGDDPEDLHQLRVATRRLRAFLRAAGRSSTATGRSRCARSSAGSVGCSGRRATSTCWSSICGARWRRSGASGRRRGPRSQARGASAQRRVPRCRSQRSTSDRYFALLDRLEAVGEPGPDRRRRARWRRSCGARRSAHARDVRAPRRDPDRRRAARVADRASSARATRPSSPRTSSASPARGSSRPPSSSRTCSASTRTPSSPRSGFAAGRTAPHGRAARGRTARRAAARRRARARASPGLLVEQLERKARPAKRVTRLGRPAASSCATGQRARGARRPPAQYGDWTFPKGRRAGRDRRGVRTSRGGGGDRARLPARERARVDRVRGRQWPAEARPLLGDAADRRRAGVLARGRRGTLARAASRGGELLTYERDLEVLRGLS